MKTKTKKTWTLKFRKLEERNGDDLLSKLQVVDILTRTYDPEHLRELPLFSGLLRKQQAKKVMDELHLHRILSGEDRDLLLRMIDSEDEENLMVAESAILSIIRNEKGKYQLFTH